MKKKAIIEIQNLTKYYGKIKRIEDLSLENLKKLGIVLAFMHEPKILILDEPTSGLDPIMQNIFLFLRYQTLEMLL